MLATRKTEVRVSYRADWMCETGWIHIILTYRNTYLSQTHFIIYIPVRLLTLLRDPYKQGDKLQSGYKHTVRCIKNWVNLQDQSMVSHDAKFSWSLVTSYVFQGTMLETILFSICINDLSDGIDGTPNKSADDTKMRRVLDIPVCCAAIQVTLTG